MLTKRQFLTGMIAASWMASSAKPSSAASKPKLELLLFDQPGCVSCVAFKRKIGKTYASTRLGKQAPLRRINTRQAMPRGYKRYAHIKNTPTFILLANGREVQRMVGYGGELFFWGFLSSAIDQANAKS